MSLLSELTPTVVSTQTLTSNILKADAVHVDTLIADSLTLQSVSTDKVSISDELITKKGVIHCDAESACNILIGDQTDDLPPITDGVLNVCLGVGAGRKLTEGSGNLFFGGSSGSEIDTSNNNIAIGLSAMQGSIGLGQENIAIGAGSMNQTGDSYNIAVGTAALRSCSGGNIAIGYQASGGPSPNVGDNNIILGYQSGYNNSMTDLNIMIGTGAGAQGTYNNAVTLGAYSVAGKSNVIHIGKRINAPQFNKTILGYTNGSNGAPNLIPGFYNSDAAAKIGGVLPGQLYIKRYNTGLFAPPNEQHVLCICLQ